MVEVPVRFFASCWERLPKYAVAPMVAAFVLGFNVVGHSAALTHLLALPAGFGWA